MERAGHSTPVSTGTDLGKRRSAYRQPQRPATPQRIGDCRQQNGCFKKIED